MIVRDNTALARFELDIEGAIAFANYRRVPGTVVITTPRCPARTRPRHRVGAGAAATDELKLIAAAALSWAKKIVRRYLAGNNWRGPKPPPTRGIRQAFFEPLRGMTVRVSRPDPFRRRIAQPSFAQQNLTSESMHVGLDWDPGGLVFAFWQIPPADGPDARQE
jgi:hypothetical protein